MDFVVFLFNLSTLLSPKKVHHIDKSTAILFFLVFPPSCLF